MTHQSTATSHKSEITEPKLRMAVIGGGHLGRIHARLLANRGDIEFVTVCDPSPESRGEVESKLGLPTSAEYENLPGNVDAVVIATPTILHHRIGRWALEHGIHALIEKPIACTVREADDLIATADRHNRCLQIGHIERFNPVWACARESIPLDSIQHIDARREGIYTGRSTDIGIVLDLMIHDIDLILSLVTEPVISIRASGRSVLGEHEDFAIADLVFRNGVTAHLRASRISPAPVRSMEIHGLGSWVSIDFSNSKCNLTQPSPAVASGELLADTLPIAERLKVKDEMFTRWLQQIELPASPANAMVDEQTDFIQSIQNRRSPIVSGRDGARALRVACEITNQIASQSQQISGIIPASRLAAARRRAG
ncbi:MAG: Gfo/Idh/MocA family oxidoreductase [Planctomycetes bacterium]|nr:Gfo/Idh/MocA family oxidoreductase [Planctomycetota bacterium]